jgi:tRNA modification GTPase
MKQQLLKRFYSSNNRIDTIYALTTGNSIKSAVSMVRISGPLSTSIFTKMTKNKKIPEPRKSILRSIHHPISNEPLDESILVYYKNPHSFTGEDVVEIGLHGGRAVLSDVISALSSIEGFRMAEPGEFSKTAYLNGKMDITQVEGLSDLIQAETTQQRLQALNQMNGKLGNVVSDWRNEIVYCLAHMTALVDFGEDYEINEDVLKNSNL